MADILEGHDPYSIVATGPRAAERAHVLKHGDTFAVFDAVGDVGAFGPGQQGLYHEGTRFLSRFRLRLNGARPLLLSSRVKEDNELFGADLTNPDMPLGDSGLVLPRELVHLFRSRFLWEGTWHERVRVWNYSRAPVRVALTFDVEADFADIFEVRGTARARRGHALEPVVDGPLLRLGYRGLDGEDRWLLLEWSEPPSSARPGQARFDYELAPHSPASLTVSMRCERAERKLKAASYEAAETSALGSLEDSKREYAVVEGSSERFNLWVRRSAADLRMLVSKTANGDYPFAGVPWFSTAFGRDGIITALQTLWVNHRLARGVLEVLAATQADFVDEARDAEPGKILHETRSSEMARLGEVPFGRYYGSVDATPLFVVLAGAYYARTADLAFAKKLWPHVERALEWIDRFGDADGDGFIEYQRKTPQGLLQQGWKDSQDSVFDAEGKLAESPIALCEAQAYVYDARVQAAMLASELGQEHKAQRLLTQAEALRVAFEAKFWCEEKSTYALALDGQKRQCRVRTSNAGHCLFGGIASPQRARLVAEHLLGADMFSGWGIRTVAAGESRYNPMAYHNGSVWPHDTALVTMGFSRYHFDDLLAAPFHALFDASVAMDGHRLPELFCGFHRRVGEGPTLYPVACSPQAWASSVVFGMLQACLRFSLDAHTHQLCIDRPTLPPFLGSLRLTKLEVPQGEVDLLFERHLHDVNVTVLDKRGDVEVRVLK